MYMYIDGDDGGDGDYGVALMVSHGLLNVYQYWIW